MQGVYTIQNLVNGKIYVGSSVNFRSRWEGHRKCLRNNKHRNRHLQRAWNSYGEAAFFFDAVERVQCSTDLEAREQFWMDKLNSYQRDKGYNISPTAGNKTVSDETRRLMSLRAKERIARLGVPFKGKTHSEQTRSLIAENTRRQVWTPERRAARSIASKAVWKDADYAANQRAVRNSEEFSKRMSLARRGK